jgi:hypothetical protein
MRDTYRQPWIYSPTIDGLFILGPAWIITLVLLASPSLLAESASVSPVVWLATIVCVDVAHVYSTLFRTYFDKRERRSRPVLYLGTPLICFILAVIAYSLNAAIFWTLLAYLAVFHFVRQQYGLLMLYAREDRASNSWSKRVDQATIYLATLYPLIYWHTHLPTGFHWFVDGDFISLPSIVNTIAAPSYVLCLSAYFLKEIWARRTTHSTNWPKHFLVAGTAASWYVGIVIAKGDLGFTLANVLAHGIPYMTLIWIYGSNQRAMKPRSKKLFSIAALPAFLGLLFAFGYIEEALWDGLVWRDHFSLFAWAWVLPNLTAHTALSICVPLLTLPQLTHYILDGFIWRLKDNPNWRQTFFYHSLAKDITQ